LAVGDSVEVNVSGISTVIATVSDVYGCTMQLRFNISMYMFDVTTDAPTEPICAQGGELVINATDNTNSDLSYLWTSTTGIIGSADSSTVTVNPANAEDLVLTVTNNAFNNCSEEISVPISLGTIDAIINSSEGTELDFGESTTLTVTPVGDNFSYVWEDESTDPSRIIMPEAGTTTTYTVTVTDNDTGCIGEASITITVATPLCADDESVFLPTAFSPNNDGQNDILMVRGNGLESVDLQVMDRWGKEVYRGGLLAEGWNGRHKNIGKELSPDVFAFALRAVCEDGTEILRRGHINLIR
ncbi:MAG: gliding motility-associated-like protein, partial [Saprospiraceae bacterium]